MSVPTVSLNEATPDGGDYKRDGDNRIREYKTQNRQVVGVDHKYESSGQDADMGKHNQVSLLEQDGTGVTGAEGKPVLYAKTVSGKAELVFRDEDDDDVQITSDGALVGATAQSIIAIIYPVGALYFTLKNENPGTTLGIGTWVAFGAGKMFVGINAADGDFDTIEETGGAKEVTLSVAEMPAHVHNETYYSNEGAQGFPGSTNAGTTNVYPSDSTGGDGAHNNLPPYIVLYAWKRTV